MGRRTYETLARPLPDRLNLVLTHDPQWSAAGCVAVHSPEAALAVVGNSGRLFVIGGAQVYLACWRFVNHLELTEVHAAIDGDTYLQGFNRNAWLETAREEHVADAKHAHAFSFVTLERR